MDRLPHGWPATGQITRRQFSAAAVMGAFAAGLPQDAPPTPVTPTTQSTDPDVRVSTPGIAAESAVAIALSGLRRGVDDLTIEVLRDPEIWDVAVIPSQDPPPDGLLDLRSTVLLGVVPHQAGSPLGRVQDELTSLRFTIAAARPAVFVRSDLLTEQGFGPPTTLEDLVALVLNVAYGRRHKYGFSASHDATVWAETAASFVTNLSAHNQRDLIKAQLSAGYDVLSSLVDQAGPPDLANYDRSRARSTFFEGESAVLFDDALLSAEIFEEATQAGFAISTFPAPLGPAGHPGLLIPGLDVTISSAASDISSASRVAAEVAVLSTKDRADVRAAATLPAITTDGGRALTLPVHIEPGPTRDSAIDAASLLLSR